MSNLPKGSRPMASNANPVGNKTHDIDRSLAIFYHPLFQQNISSWCHIFQANAKLQDIQINFLTFIEFDLKIQKCLLPTFDMNNAFVSALNDWVKEVTECYNYKELFSTNDTSLVALKRSLEDFPIKLTLPHAQYSELLTKYAEHDAFKLLKYSITSEVLCKFLFDLCSTWCEYLDIELFVFFLFSIFINITQGATIEQSRFKETQAITNLSLQFFNQFEKMKVYYEQNKKKCLRYYRSWCEWNYLRLNDLGENLIIQLTQIFGEDNEQRILSLVFIFEKSIDIINNEITSQMQKSISSQLRGSQILDMNHRNSKCLSQGPANQDQQIIYHERESELMNKLSAANQQKAPWPQEQYLAHYDMNGKLIVEKSIKLPIFGMQMNVQKKEEQLSCSRPRRAENDTLDKYSSFGISLDRFSKKIPQKRRADLKRTNMPPVRAEGQNPPDSSGRSSPIREHSPQGKPDKFGFVVQNSISPVRK